jgi:putative flippase GtrA
MTSDPRSSDSVVDLVPPRQPMPTAGAVRHGAVGAWGQLATFAAIGVLSAFAYLLLFLLLREVGPAQEANLGALLITAFGNTAANRRLTFGVRGRAGAGRAQVRGLLVFAVGLALTSGALLLLHLVAPRAPRLVEVAVLVGATGLAAVTRFVLFQGWVFRDTGPDRGGPPARRGTA